MQMIFKRFELGKTQVALMNVFYKQLFHRLCVMKGLMQGQPDSLYSVAEFYFIFLI